MSPQQEKQTNKQERQQKQKTVKKVLSACVGDVKNAPVLAKGREILAKYLVALCHPLYNGLLTNILRHEGE